MDESLEIIHSSSGWNEEHTFAIENATTEEFLDWFKSKPENMIDKIRKILSISNWPKAHEALTQALQIMYDDNELNKIRISKMLSGYFTPQVKE